MDQEEKPRRSSMSLKKIIFNYYKKEMEEETREFLKNNKNISNLGFYLFQQIKDETEIEKTLIKLAYFYDRNYIGNKDFMHIPKISDIITNYIKYPIIIASTSKGEILGATTIKMQKNKKITDNPYFPNKDEIVLSITGILSKRNGKDEYGSSIKGIGRTLYKAGIKGAYKINKIRKIRLICEIDCRNEKSIKSIEKAIEELKKEGINTNAFIIGYYEIKKQNNKLKEAPTFIVEIDLDGKKQDRSKKVEISYANCSKKYLLQEISQELQRKTLEIKQHINIKNDNNIIYHEIKPINISKIIIETGKSAEGNDRIPELPVLQTKYV